MLRKSLFAAFACSILCFAAGSRAQGYPGKPVRVIVPAATGGPDVVARLIAAQLTLQTGQSFIVENKPGANGILGADAVAKSAPDGYTLMVYSSGLVINPSIYKKLPYDTEKDFAPVTNIVLSPGLFIIVNSRLPVKTLQDLIDMGRRPDSKLSFSSPGVGNTLHLAGEIFNARAGTKILHIPYKGGGPAVAAVVAGEVQVMFSSPAPAMPQMKAGGVRALAYTGTTRNPSMPDVPTTAEAGLPSYQIDGGWFGMFAPANTPAEIVDRLYREVRTAVANPQVQEKLVALGVEPLANSPAEFRQFVHAEIASYAESVRLAGIKPE
jgi:tripartite-type tricarboxylate transporter receptor subunit TctC